MEEGQLAKRAENGGGSTSKESRDGETLRPEEVYDDHHYDPFMPRHQL